MVTLTDKEKEALLILFKDFTAYYNANSLSKILKISRVGTLKLLKRLEGQDLLSSQKIGKSIVYKVKLQDDYVKKLIAFLLADEAQGLRRWKEEFKGLQGWGRIVVLFGSVLRDYEKANDIDLLVVSSKADSEAIAKELNARAEILPKRLHFIRLTDSVLKESIRSKEASVLDIVRTGVVLIGQDEYVEVLKNVTSS